MALGFFRKWQKSIIVIMVALMLSFLVGGTGMKILCDQRRGVVPRGESQFGAISNDDVRQADNDIQVLSQYLNLSAWSMDFIRLRQNGDNAAIAYILLQQEASAAGYAVDDSEITGYLTSIGLEKGSKEYMRFLGRIERRDSGTTEPDLRAALGRWLMVMRSFNAYKVVSPPSDVTLRKLFRDLNEKLTLRIVLVSAEKYADSIPDPTEQQINEQFAKYSKMGAGIFRKDGKGDTFGFGYAQPARVALAYLSVNSDAIARVTRPGDRAVRDYFRENASQFVKAVPVTTQPATASQPVATRPEQMSLDEAWDQIVERLTGAATDTRTEEFVQLLQINVDAESTPSADRYKKVYARMFDSAAANNILSRSISAADIASLRGKSLAQAMPLLARAAGLDTICYPWETEGEFSVSKDVLVPVTLQADVPRTLAVVIDEITRLVFAADKEPATTQPTTAPAKASEPAAPQYPKIKWTTCQGFAKVLFPVGPDSDTTILPITIGQTMLLSANKLAEHKEIGSATSSITGRGSRLVTEAMKAKPLFPGRTMYVSTATGQHQILWQAVESRPAAILKAPVGDVRKDVIRDFKILQAYKTIARGTAENLVKKATLSGLEAAAKEAKLDHYDSEPTARLSAWSRRDQINMQVRYMAMMPPPAGMTREEHQARLMSFARQAMNYRPREYSPSMVKDVDVKTIPAAQRFIDRIFDDNAKLVPVNIEAPIAPDSIGPVISIPMPTARAHYVVQRIGYTPAVVSDFKDVERKNLAQTAVDNSEWDARQVFFGYTKIAARAKYELLTNKKAAVSAP